MNVSSVLIDLVRGIIAELRGKDVADWTTEKVAAAVADKVKEAIAATIAAELRVFAGALDLRLASDELADAASRLLVAMREAESKPCMVARALEGAQITILGPGEHIDDAPVIDGQPVAPIGEDEPKP